MLYKVTDARCRTQGNTEWGRGVTHEALGEPGQPLASNGWIHAYEDPDLAALLSPLYSPYPKPRLWEAKGEIGIRDGLRLGCRRLTTIREIPWPCRTSHWKAMLIDLIIRRIRLDSSVFAHAWKQVAIETARLEMSARAIEASCLADRNLNLIEILNECRSR